VQGLISERSQPEPNTKHQTTHQTTRTKPERKQQPSNRSITTQGLMSELYQLGKIDRTIDILLADQVHPKP
jgi:hypothetical protein